MMMLYRIRHSKNGYLQGSIFLANLLYRSLKHLRVKSRCQRLFASKPWYLEEYKKSDTLFILGSGASIAGYSKSQLDVIKRHDSIGFNFWLLHPLVPTYYVAELYGNSERSSILWKNLIIRAPEYKNIPVIIKYNSFFWQNHDHPPISLKNVYISTHMSIPGMTEKSLGRWFLFLDFFHFFSGLLPPGFILYRQASLSWLLVFAIQLKYKRIIFCGVDLKTPHYFYDFIKDSINIRGMFIPPSGFTTTVHPTNNISRCIGGLNIVDILNIMDKKLIQKRNMQIFTGSKESALFPLFPLFPWNEF